jgi:hypothetical protein
VAAGVAASVVEMEAAAVLVDSAAGVQAAAVLEETGRSCSCLWLLA